MEEKLQEGFYRNHLGLRGCNSRKGEGNKYGKIVKNVSRTIDHIVGDTSIQEYTTHGGQSYISKWVTQQEVNSFHVDLHKVDDLIQELETTCAALAKENKLMDRSGLDVRSQSLATIKTHRRDKSLTNQFGSFLFDASIIAHENQKTQKPLHLSIGHRRQSANSKLEENQRLKKEIENFRKNYTRGRFNQLQKKVENPLKLKVTFKETPKILKNEDLNRDLKSESKIAKVEVKQNL